MSLKEFEQKLGVQLPKDFRRFIQKHSNGYIPANRNYTSDQVRDMVLEFYSIEDLWKGWQNTAEYSYMKDDRTMIIAHLLGDSTFVVGIGESNADIVYYLDWHMGLTPIASSINQLLMILVKE